MLVLVLVPVIMLVLVLVLVLVPVLVLALVLVLGLVLVLVLVLVPGSSSQAPAPKLQHHELAQASVDITVRFFILQKVAPQCPRAHLRAWVLNCQSHWAWQFHSIQTQGFLQRK